jgi:MFS family permease
MVRRELGRLRLASKVLAEPDVRWAQIAYLGANIAEMATWVAILVYAFNAGGAGLVGVVAAVQLVVAGLLAPWLASLGDRFARRTVLLGWYTAMVVTSASVAVALFTGMSVVVVVALAAADAAAVSAARPIHASLLPALTRRPWETVAAYSLSGVVEGSGLLFGPLMAGLILAAASPGAVYLASAAVMVVSAGGVLAVRGGRVVVDPEDGSSVGPAGGIRALMASNEVRWLVGLGGLSQVVIGALDILLVVLAIDVLGLGDAGAGYLNALLGLGAIVGSIASGRLAGRRRLGAAVRSAGELRGLSLAAVGAVPQAFPLLVLTGAGQAYLDVAGRSLLQRMVPARVISLAFGVVESMSMFGLAVGALAVPVLIGAVGPTGALVAVGLLLPVAVLIASRSLERADRASALPAGVVEVLEAADAFATLDVVGIEALALGSEVVQVEAGHPVVREGDPGDRCFVIGSGRFRVEASGREMAVLGPGDLFGEIALLFDTPRKATVTAVTHGELVALTRARFLEIVGGDGEARQLAARRLADLDEV